MPRVLARLLMATVSIVATLAAGHHAVPAATAATPKVTAPPVNGRFDYQIGGPYAPASNVAIVDRDWHEQPAAGKYNVCYVNGFQTQADEKSFWTSKHPGLLLRKNGKLVEDPDWPGEYMLDTSTSAKRTAIAAIEDGWIDTCAKKGFRAVEPDNLDSYTRSQGLLTQAGNLAMATLLATHAHGDGLAIAQKNTVELGALGRTKARFDFAIAEECQVYAECDGYTKPYGRHVVEIEYTDNPRKYYTQACQARGPKISILLRDRDVVAKGQPGYTYQTC
jgi:hypothetical protein